MARPKKEETKIQYSVMLEPSIIKEIQRLADKAEVKPGPFTRNLIKSGLEEAQLFDKAGLIGLVGASRRKMDGFRKRFNLTFDTLDIFEKEK